MAFPCLHTIQKITPHIPRPVRTAIKFCLGWYRLVEGPLHYNQDGLATRYCCDFMKDPRFLAAYRCGEATGSWGEEKVHWRAFVACWAADKGKDLEGDFIECGVNKGGLARAVMEYINFKALPKTFYLLDTFCGLSEKYILPQERIDGIHPGGYEECYEQVRRTFAEFPNVRIVRGTVPDTLPQVAAKKVAYLSLDMNCVVPEVAAAEYFWDKLASGAVIVLDDYNFSNAQNQRRGLDEFAARKGVQVLAMPTGQGLIVKP